MYSIPSKGSTALIKTAHPSPKILPDFSYGKELNIKMKIIKIIIFNYIF